MSQNEKGLNILICGSQKFNDDKFVFGMMDQIYKAYNGKLDTIYTSRFSGSCEYVRKWLDTTNEVINECRAKNQMDLPNIQSRDCTFDMHLAKENISLYEDMEIPDFIIQNDPFFQKGKELLLANGINMILAFPNPQGILGPSTKNIHKFARLAQLEQNFFDCSEAYKQIKQFRNDNLIIPDKTIQTPATGFVNKHPGKKF